MMSMVRRRMTDKSARYWARELVSDSLVYIHKGSNTLRIAHPDGEVVLMDYEMANRNAAYIGFTPTPDSPYLDKRA